MAPCHLPPQDDGSRSGCRACGGLAHHPRLRQQLEGPLLAVGEERKEHVDPEDLQAQREQADDGLAEADRSP